MRPAIHGIVDLAALFALSMIAGAAQGAFMRAAKCASDYRSDGVSYFSPRWLRTLMFACGGLFLIGSGLLFASLRLASAGSTLLLDLAYGSAALCICLPTLTLGMCGLLLSIPRTCDLSFTARRATYRFGWRRWTLRSRSMALDDAAGIAVVTIVGPGGNQIPPGRTLKSRFAAARRYVPPYPMYYRLALVPRAPAGSVFYFTPIGCPTLAVAALARQIADKSGLPYLGVRRVRPELLSRLIGRNA